MNFDFTDDQNTIRATARELLANRSTWERVRTAAEGGQYDERLSGELNELGWPGIAIAEEHGGQGLGAIELTVLLEELGRACAPVPFLGTVLAATAIEHAGSEEQKARWLPALASGEARGALGEARGGSAELVPDAPGADVVVLLDEDGGATLHERPQVEAISAIDLTRRYGRLGAGGGEPLAGSADAVRGRAAASVAAELVGLSQRALEMTVEYVKDRKQFGVPVGGFQAVAHKCAQMLLDTEGARSAAYAAAWAADADPERLPFAAAVAKAAASEGARSATAAAIQLHGGIGFTWEADLHWLFKRAQVGAAFLGGGSTHRARAAALGARTPAPAAG